MLKAAIETYKLSTKQILIKFCETRGAEKANCIENFLELLLAIVAVLDELRLENGDVVLLSREDISRSYDKFNVDFKSLQKIDSGIISSMQLIKYLLKNIEKWLDGEGVGSYESICKKVEEIEKMLLETTEVQIIKPQGRRRRVNFETEFIAHFYVQEFKH
uniref:Uncharacterized protein n=1 Tax=Panagrolaimus davidi TaxID=227884 RepID=A0A914P4D8_9BILA